LERLPADGAKLWRTDLPRLLRSRFPFLDDAAGLDVMAARAIGSAILCVRGPGLEDDTASDAHDVASLSLCPLLPCGFLTLLLRRSIPAAWTVAPDVIRSKQCLKVIGRPIGLVL